MSKTVYLADKFALHTNGRLLDTKLNRLYLCVTLVQQTLECVLLMHAACGFLLHATCALQGLPHEPITYGHESFGC